MIDLEGNKSIYKSFFKFQLLLTTVCYATCYCLVQVPKGLEMGVGTMTRKEKADIFVSGTYLTMSSLMPHLEGLEEVCFHVELVQFIQVRS